MKKQVTDDEAIVAGVRSAVEFMLDLVSYIQPNPPKTKSTIELNENVSKRKLSSKCYDDLCTKRIKLPLYKSSQKTSDVETLSDTPSIIEPIKKLLTTNCYICNEEKYEYHAVYENKMIYLCSDKCLEKFRSNRLDIIKNKCVNCNAKFDPSSFTYKPILGTITRSCCSEKCFHEYNESNKPKFLCRSKECTVQLGDIFYRWQGMEFCSISCICKVIKDIGRSCFNCKSTINSLFISKFTHRSGINLRHFCSKECRYSSIRMIKKVCIFCQTPFPDPDVKFCSTTCETLFARMSKVLNLIKENGRPGEICDICNCHVTIEDITNNFFNYRYVFENDNGDEFKFICSTLCNAVYRSTHEKSENNCLVCDSTSFVKNGVFYRTSDGILPFCSSICFVIYTCKTVVKVNCRCCKKETSIFDSFEEFNMQSSLINFYCSVQCVSLMSESDRCFRTYENSLIYIKCAKCKKVAPNFINRPEKNTNNILTYCTFNCFNTCSS